MSSKLGEGGGGRELPENANKTLAEYLLGGYTAMCMFAVQGF